MDLEIRVAHVHRRLRITLFQQAVAEVGMGRGMVRLDGDGAPVGGLGLIESAQFLQRVS